MFAEQRLDDLVVFEKSGIKDRVAPGDPIRFLGDGALIEKAARASMEPAN
jgi:hypothetical protein